MPSRYPPPLLQGELDALCGIYSTVNSIRCALTTFRRKGPKGVTQVRNLADEDCIDLFGVLLSDLVSERQVLKPIWQGLNIAELVRLLHSASGWLTEHRSLHASLVRPFAANAKVTTREFHKALASHLVKPGTAAIIRVEHPSPHFTVVQATTPDRLMLCDSYGDESISLRSLNNPRGANRRRQAKPGLAILVTVSERPEQAKPPAGNLAKAAPVKS